MSVIVKEPEGRILLLSKGADRSVLYDFHVLVTGHCQTFVCLLTF